MYVRVYVCTGMLCYVFMTWPDMLCFAVCLCNVCMHGMLCYVTLCYNMLCYVMYVCTYACVYVRMYVRASAGFGENREIQRRTCKTGVGTSTRPEQTCLTDIQSKTQKAGHFDTKGREKGDPNQYQSKGGSGLRLSRTRPRVRCRGPRSQGRSSTPRRDRKPLVPFKVRRLRLKV